MPPTLDVVIGLGSNLGDRLAQLQASVDAIGRLYVVSACSAVYETAPVGPPQPDYLNAAVRIAADARAEEVLESLLSIERTGGRVRTAENRWGARTVDLDVLWIDAVVLDTPTLTVPHPRLTERTFALRPLLDVAPEAIDPRTGARFSLASPAGDVRRTDLLLRA